jgi:diacylglycerol kinase family enzyme
VIPLGTANALARNLNIPLDPVVAVATLLGYAPRQIPLGQVTTAGGRRWFVLMAGCGPDGALAARLPAAAKQRLGRIAYYAYALRLFLTTRWPAFQVRYRLWGQDLWSETTAVALLAARVPDLGGLFSGLTPKAHLTQEALHVQMLREPAWLSFPAWFVCAWLGLPNPWLTTLDVAEVEALAGAGGAPVLAQADAEALGPLPMHLRVVPHALSLLMPPDATD